MVEGEGGGELPANPPSPTAPGGPGVEEFQAYEKCLDEARPEDTEALQRCAELLNAP